MNAQISSRHLRNRKNSLKQIMNIRIFFQTLLLILLSVPLPAESKDDPEIRSAMKAFTTAIDALDLDRTMACYANKPDISVFSPGLTEPVVGWTAVRKDWSDFFAFLKSNHSGSKSELSDIAIESDGKLAFAYFTTTGEFVLKDGARVKPLFRSTLIFEKIDGHWLIIHEHVSEPNKK
jgi:ketosteroid isomerase-like protein